MFEIYSTYEQNKIHLRKSCLIPLYEILFEEITQFSFKQAEHWASISLSLLLTPYRNKGFNNVKIAGVKNQTLFLRARRGYPTYFKTFAEIVLQL